MALRLRRATHPLGDTWRDVPLEPRGSTRLGISLRPLQCEAFGLDPAATLTRLLHLPFDLTRLGAYWSRMEPEPGTFEPAQLDIQLELAEAAGRNVIICVGPVKTFGYPDFHVPGHVLERPLPEGRLVTPSSHPALLDAAMAFATRVVERYRSRPSVIAWQVEHEPLDPLGAEHTWRLGTSFVEAEMGAVRAADPSRPILLNGFLPTSLPVRFYQRWQTRDQGDSLAIAQRLADIVGIDFYPRHAVARLGPLTLYLDAKGTGRRGRELLDWARHEGRRLMVAEGQAEPWEAVTTPPSPAGEAMYSCPPEQVIANYNSSMAAARQAGAQLDAYLFWGAEYWVLREQAGDPRYMQAALRLMQDPGSGDGADRVTHDK